MIKNIDINDVKQSKNYFYNIHMDTLRTIYTVILADRNKERFDMILEPLQAMTQLALLSFCPIGSKLSIYQNVLYVQTPNWTQSIKRNYNADKKDHLMFLFGVISRFHKFYGFMRDSKGKQKELFECLLRLSKIGIDKLVQTYNHSGAMHLTQTLRMYQAMLDRPENFTDADPNAQSNNSENIINIDTVFNKVTELYSIQHFNVLYNLLYLLENNPHEYEHYEIAINSSLRPVTNNLQKWISDNIVF